MKNILTLIFLILCFVSVSNAQNSTVFSGDGVKLLKNKLKFKDTNGAIRFDSGNIEITTDGGTGWTPLGGIASGALQIVDADGDSTADFFTDDAFFIKLLNQSGFTFKVDPTFTTLTNVLKLDTTNNFIPLINPILTNTLGSEGEVETYLKFEHKMDALATPTVGFGAAQSVWLENSNDIMEHASKIETKWTDVTNTSEDAVLTFSVFTNGIPDPVDHIKLENNELHLLSRAGVEGKVVFHEQGTNGTDKLTISAPALGQSKAYTLPANEPAALVPTSVLGVTPAGVMSWVDPATFGGDTTRIQDAGNNTYVDTDEVANTVTMSSAGRTATWASGKLNLKESAGSLTRPELQLSEAPVNGSEYVALRSASAMDANYTLSLPATAPAANQILESDASGNLSWINTPAGGGGDTTRITDGGAVWVDTDEVTGQVIMNIGDARAIWTSGQFTIDAAGGESVPASIAFSEAPDSGNDLIKLSAPQGAVASYFIQLPAGPPTNANQILQSDATVDNVAILNWVDTPAGGGGGDSTRIQDGDNTTFVDTDATLDTINMQAGNGTTNSTVSLTSAALTTTLPNNGTVSMITGRHYATVSEEFITNKGYLGLHPNWGFATPEADTEVMQLRFYEPVNDGGNYVGLEAPDNLGANYTLRFPTAAPSANQILQSDAAGNLSWIATPAGGGGDSTRINDFADTTFVDTDSIANAITWNAQNGVADATCSATFDATGFFDKNDFQFATCNSHIIRFTGTNTENATLRITDNGSANTSPRFYFDVSQGAKWYIIRPPDVGGTFNNSELILPNDPPTAAGQVLSVKTVVDTDTHQTEWVTPDSTRIQDGDNDTYVDVDSFNTVVMKAGNLANLTLDPSSILSLYGTENAELKLFEASANGTNNVTFAALDSIAVSHTLNFGGDTLPTGGRQAMTVDASGNVNYDFGAFRYPCQIRGKKDDNLDGMTITTAALMAPANYDKIRWTGSDGSCGNMILPDATTANTDYEFDAYYESFQVNFGIYQITCEMDVYNAESSSKMIVHMGLYFEDNISTGLPVNQWSNSCYTVERLEPSETKRIRFTCEYLNGQTYRMSLRATKDPLAGVGTYGRAHAATFGLSTGEIYNKCVFTRGWYYF
jgi:hypothetical protein